MADGASDMPERIWAWGTDKLAWWYDKPEEDATEYVRASALAEAREALEAIRDKRGKCWHCGRKAEGAGSGFVHCDEPHSHGGKMCSWTEQDPAEIASAALAKIGG